MIDNGNRPVLVVSNNPSRAERVAECLRKEGGTDHDRDPGGRRSRLDR